MSSTLQRPRRLSAARRTILCGLRMSCSVSPCRALCSPLAGKGTAQHWTAGLAVVVSGGLGMPDVHGRTNARDIKAAGNCDHAHVRVVTASGVHFSRAQTIDVLEQVLLAVRQDAVDHPSPPDAGGRCRPRVLTEKPKVKRLSSVVDVHESAEKRTRRRSATLVAKDKDVAASAADGLQP